MEITIDIEKLRQDLIDYFGSAMQFYRIAVIDLSDVQNASDEEIVKIAIQNGFDLEKYKVDYRKSL